MTPIRYNPKEESVSNPRMRPNRLDNQQKRQPHQGNRHGENHQSVGRVELNPAICDIGGGIGPNCVKPKLTERKLPIETINEVQAKADNCHHRAQF